MKYFLDKNGVVFGFESDGSQDFLITSDMSQMNDEEFAEYCQIKAGVDQSEGEA